MTKAARQSIRLGACALLLLGLGACEKSDGGAYAKRVETPKELIGGPSALGAVGDWTIGNTLFRVVVQDQGWSRGFGIFGGGIIDADLVRPGAEANDAGGTGRDNFGELFPALFLRAFDVADQEYFDIDEGAVLRKPGIEVIADGSDGGPAILRARASGGDFLTLVSDLVDLAVPNDGLVFETDFIVRPGSRHVEIVGRLKNISSRVVDLSGSGLAVLLGALGVEELQLPLGDVVLFGAGNRVFAPGAVGQPDERLGAFKPAGFDLRFAVETSYGVQGSLGVGLPALPGLVTEVLATSGPGVSYGYAVGESDRNYVWMNRDMYGLDDNVTPTRHSLLVPFLIDSFTGAYFEVPPNALAPAGQEGSVFEYRRYFIVGHGDVASIRDELFRIRGAQTGTFEGRVINELTGAPERQATIHVLDANRYPYTQIQVDRDGRFRADVEPGVYFYIVTAPGRYPYPEGEAAVDATALTMEASRGVFRHIMLPPPAELAVQVRDETERLIPAKVSVVSRYDAQYDGLKPEDFLFDYWLGESRRSTDMSWVDAGGDKPREFVETNLRTDIEGFAVAPVRHSRCGDDGACEREYDIYVSRGMEYDLFVQRGVKLLPGRRTHVEARLHRVVDTTDYVSADLHVHTVNSVDSFAGLREQVLNAAAEGVEILVATDHNFVTDLKPAIAATHMQDFVGSVIGVELTTLEMGHFNAFPMEQDFDAASRFPFVDYCFAPLSRKTNRTSFDWVLCNPTQLFDNLRALGSLGPEDTIIHVNHPRDTILGYFNQFYVNPYTAQSEAPHESNYPEVGFLIYPHRPRTGQFHHSQFTLDFDALEVANGKRMDMLHAFRLGENISQEDLDVRQDYACGSGHPNNAPGQPLLRKGGHVAFPGAVDDWLNILNMVEPAQAPVPTGNSDSHGLDKEMGVPRTFLHLEPSDGHRRDEHPAAISPMDIVESLRRKRVLVTNGPFLEMTALVRPEDSAACAAFSAADSCESGGCEWSVARNVCLPAAHVAHTGEVVTFGRDATDAPIELSFHVQSAPWVRVEKLLVYANGSVIDTIEVPSGRYENGRHLDDDIVLPWVWPAGFERDAVVVLEAVGSNSLFPVVTPNEEPPTNIGEALGGLAGGLGVDLSGFSAGDGVVAPTFIQRVTPYALTSPIWFDIDGDGRFTPPGNDPGPGPAPSATCDSPTRSLALNPTPTPMELLFGREHRPAHYPVWDIRKLFPLHEKH